MTAPAVAGDVAVTRRLDVVRDAVEAAGAGLMKLRGKPTIARNLLGDPYKTSADRAAEAWIVESLRSIFPDDAILAEEAFDARKEVWQAPHAFWTIDALDGTASFVDGFDGFCVQAAYIVNGIPTVGVVHEPVRQVTHWATKGGGAWQSGPDGTVRKLELEPIECWPQAPVFIDSTLPKGVAGAFFELRAGQFLECGSTGVKICRVAEGQAHVMAKPVRYKLWDIAPGDIILTEAGGKLAMWDGTPVRYDTSEVRITNLLATPRGLFDLAVDDLMRLSGDRQ